MPDRLQLFKMLTDYDDLIIDQSMVEALPSADIEAQRFIVQSIIQRGKANGLMGLIKAYHRLDGGLMHQINEKINLFASVLRNASRVADTQTIDNIITIIERTSAVDLAYLLAYLMPAGKAKVAERSASCLLDLTQLMLVDSQPEDLAAMRKLYRQRAQILEAIVYAAHQYGRHRQADIIQAILLWIQRRDPDLIKEIELNDSAIKLSLANMLRTPDQPIYQEKFWCLVLLEDMHDAAVQGLHHDFSDDARMRLVANAHLTILPKCREALFAMTSISVFIQPTLRMKRCPVEYGRKLIRLLKNMRLSTNERLVIYSRMIESEDRVIRLLVLRELLHINEEDAHVMILAMVYDPELEIARIALRKASKFTGATRDTLIQMMEDCPHPTLRMLYFHAAPGGPFEDMWDDWKEMNAQNRMMIAHRLLKQDPLFVQRLLDRVDHTKEPSENNAQILDIARTTGINHSIVPALLSFSGSFDERLASESIRAMTMLTELPEVRDVIVAALYHKSDRVKGNAIEALEMYADMSEYADRLIVLAKNRKQNRSRATAIKSMVQLKHEKADELLMAMLQDSDKHHRISALWVVKVLRVARFTPQLRVMMETDPSPAIRVRVRGVIGILEETDNSKDVELDGEDE